MYCIPSLCGYRLILNNTQKKTEVKVAVLRIDTAVISYAPITPMIMQNALHKSTA